MGFFKPKASALIYVVVMAVATAAAVVLGYTAWGAQMNANAYDLFFRIRGPETRGTERIVIVAIDDATLGARGLLPLDRRLVAKTLENICAARPAVVVIDVLFAEAAPPEVDAALQRALAGCPRAVVSTALAPGQAGAEWSGPLPELARSAAAVGHALADPDFDGVSRQVLLEKAASGKRYWALAFESFRQMQDPQRPAVETDDALELGDLRIPAPRRAQRALLVNYAGGEGVFRHVSLDDVLRETVAPSIFAGKAVLLGTTARGVGDRLFTPVSTEGIGMPGVEIHANLLHTLLERRFIRPLSESAALALLGGLAILVAVALYFWRGWKLALAAFLLLAVTHLVPYLFFRGGLVVPAFSFAAGFWLPLAVGGSYQYFAVWRGYLSADATQRRLRRRLELVSHEMRSPLTAIQGSSELISRYPLDEQRRKQMADLIHRESRRLSRMVERFLDVERLSAGEIELRREPVEVRGVIQTSAERVRPLAERKGITVEVVLEEPGEALGDAELLEFAVYNLLSNAVKYGPEGSRVLVAARALQKQVLVEVTDQGEGIRPEEAARIFDRFYRTSSAETSGNPGLGLGLAIVREVARHHGGEVTVESQPGRGSKFTLAVPAATAQAPGAPAAAPPAVAPHAAAPPAPTPTARAK